MRQQILKGIAILLGVYFIISLSKDVSGLLESQERIARQKGEVSELEKQQQELVEDLEYVMDEEFVEKEARDKLLMSRPGEEVYILPENGRSESLQAKKTSEVEEELANWEKWVRLFF